MTPAYLLFYGDGARSLRIAYTWLHPEQRHFLVRVFAHRDTLFTNVKLGLNGEFFVDGFRYQPPHINSHIWQREMVRDFVWLVAEQKNAHLHVELIAALQSLLWDHPRGKCDLFLLNLHDGLQSRCNLPEAPCWALAHWDVHPDERVEPAQSGVAARKSSGIAALIKSLIQ
jgi:hypothetical protein